MKKNTKILLFGTFDYLHPGHIDLFKQARKLARDPYLIVSIARDINVTRIKGQKAENTERDRLNLVSNCKLVDSAVLGAKKDFFKKIEKIDPDIIAIGYDQIAYVEELKVKITEKKLDIKVKRLKPFKPNLHKTTINKSKNINS